MAPSDEDYMIKLADKLNEHSENQQEICDEFKADVRKGEIKPEVISQYPDFERQVNIDSSVKGSLEVYAYKSKYELKLSEYRPEDEIQSAGFANNNEKYAYT